MGAEWKQIESIFDRFRFLGLDPRSLLNAVFYVLKTGSQWRMLPSDYPPWQTVYYHFRKWRRLNLLQRPLGRIRRAARVAAGRRPSPSAAVIDTQSVDTERQAGLRPRARPEKEGNRTETARDCRHVGAFVGRCRPSSQRARQPNRTVGVEAIARARQNV
jgi:putative transposase